MGALVDVGVGYIYRKVHVKVPGAQRSRVVIGLCLFSALVPTEAKQGFTPLHLTPRQHHAGSAKTLPMWGEKRNTCNMEKGQEVYKKWIEQELVHKSINCLQWWNRNYRSLMLGKKKGKKSTWDVGVEIQQVCSAILAFQLIFQFQNLLRFLTWQFLTWLVKTHRNNRENNALRVCVANFHGWRGWVVACCKIMRMSHSSWPLNHIMGGRFLRNGSRSVKDDASLWCCGALFDSSATVFHCVVIIAISTLFQTEPQDRLSLNKLIWLEANGQMTIILQEIATMT